MRWLTDFTADLDCPAQPIGSDAHIVINGISAGML
jgi:hypothetical protein